VGDCIVEDRSCTGDPGVASRLTVGEALARYPFLEFDLRDHLHAVRLSGALEAAIRDFQRWLDRRAPAPDPRDSLVEAARSLAGHVPAYAGLGAVRSLDEVPFVSKGDLRDRPSHFSSALLAGEPRWSKVTTGTSGPPITLHYAADFYFEQLYASLPKILALHGAAHLSRAPVMAAHITDTASTPRRVMQPPFSGAGLLVTLVLDRPTRDGARAIVETLASLRPAILTSRPELLDLLVEARTSFERARYRPSLIVSSGSALGAARRARVEGALAAPVVEAYALTELGLVAFECPLCAGMHVDETSVLAEVLPEGGRRTAREGDGELVLSSARNAAMPLLRYRTGDRVTLTEAPCRCGARGPRLAAIHGRIVPIFRFPSGDVLSPTVFNDLPRRFPIVDYQITQAHLDEIEVAVEVPAGAAGGELIALAVEAHVRTCVPGGVRVVARCASFERTMKRQRYRCLIGPG
jgi:phenylacetate-CoA ligase